MQWEQVPHGFQTPAGKGSRQRPRVRLSSGAFVRRLACAKLHRGGALIRFAHPPGSLRLSIFAALRFQDAAALSSSQVHDYALGLMPLSNPVLKGRAGGSQEKEPVVKRGSASENHRTHKPTTTSISPRPGRAREGWVPSKWMIPPSPRSFLALLPERGGWQSCARSLVRWFPMATPCCFASLTLRAACGWLSHFARLTTG
jgi:hypothetical protein